MTEVIAILDRSGSMSGKEKDVIGGFNEFIKEQKKLKGKAFLTLVLFDDQYEVVYDRVDLKDVKNITSKEYFVRGSTALLDAVGKTLGANTKKKGIAFIFTDGMENSSREYTKEKVKSLIKDKEKQKWEVHFIGADIDALPMLVIMGLI